VAWRCDGQVLAWLAEGREAGASIHGNAIEGANLLLEINLLPFSLPFSVFSEPAMHAESIMRPVVN
jgi:hypothetical protein